jgi:adenylate cyclase class 2
VTTAGNVESEIKVRMADVPSARRRLDALGAQCIQERAFEDNIVFDRERSLRAAGELLRLRRFAGTAILTFKGRGQVRDGIKVREEIETTLGDASVLEAVLGRLGFAPVFRYQKYRAVFTWRDASITLDETPVGVYLEIEGPVATIHAAAAALGVSAADYIAESYAQLHAERGGSGDMVFRE